LRTEKANFLPSGEDTPARFDGELSGSILDSHTQNKSLAPCNSHLTSKGFQLKRLHLTGNTPYFSTIEAINIFGIWCEKAIAGKTPVAAWTLERSR